MYYRFANFSKQNALPIYIEYILSFCRYILIQSDSARKLIWLPQFNLLIMKLIQIQIFDIFKNT